MLTYDMSKRGGAALYDHLYRCIRGDIEGGSIAPDQKLPSKRSLAEHLGVSLVTVEGAYAQLVAEGYVRSVPRTGYFACALPGPAHPSERFDGGSAVNARRVEPSGARDAAPPTAPSFGEGGDAEVPPAPFDARTVRVWARAVRRELASLQDAGMARSLPPQGSPRLRSAIAEHLRRFRGMDADPARIVVGAGAPTLYNLLIQLLGRNRVYAVEDPGYPLLSRLYEANEARVALLPVDECGMIVEALRATPATVAHVMPSHQFPTGAIMSVARRYELLSWASEDPSRIVIEDDYDCEFRMAGRPVPSLQSIDSSGSVVYVNTFSKSLGSDMRIAYMVLPLRPPEGAFRREAGLLLQHGELASSGFPGSHPGDGGVRTPCDEAEDVVSSGARRAGGSDQGDGPGKLRRLREHGQRASLPHRPEPPAFRGRRRPCGKAARAPSAVSPAVLVFQTARVSRRPGANRGRRVAFILFGRSLGGRVAGGVRRSRAHRTVAFLSEGLLCDTSPVRKAVEYPCAAREGAVGAMIKPLVKDVESLSVPCERASAADAGLAQDLLDTLASLDEAACLAANQIGEAKQVVVYLDSNDRPRVMFNPVLKRGLRPSRVEETCLSHEAPTKSTRFDQILVTFDELVDGALVPRKKELRGWTAQIVQHMIDHCKGKLV